MAEELSRVARGFTLDGVNAEVESALESSPLARDARALAAEAHAKQKYGDLPYLTHLDRVAEIVTEYRGVLGDRYREALAGAFLHDLVEDVPAYTPQLEARMPPAVVAIVHALSKREGLAMTDYFATIRATGLTAVAVKLADRIANVEASRASGFERKLVRYRGERAMFASMRTPGELDAMWERLERAYG